MSEQYTMHVFMTTCNHVMIHALIALIIAYILLHLCDFLVYNTFHSLVITLPFDGFYCSVSILNTNRTWLLFCLVVQVLLAV